MWRLGILCAVLLCTGCTRQVTISTTPPGARIELNGQFCGYTPITLDLNSDTRQVRLELDGYRPAHGLLRKQWDDRMLWGIPVFPLMLLPSVNTKLYKAYHVELSPGGLPQDLQVVQPLNEDPAPKKTAP